MDKREQRMAVIDKAWRVIYSCKTVEHADAARKYLQLVSQAHPGIDISAMVKELNTLFDME